MRQYVQNIIYRAMYIEINHNMESIDLVVFFSILPPIYS